MSIAPLLKQTPPEPPAGPPQLANDPAVLQQFASGCTQPFGNGTGYLDRFLCFSSLIRESAAKMEIIESQVKGWIDAYAQLNLNIKIPHRSFRTYINPFMSDGFWSGISASDLGVSPQGQFVSTALGWVRSAIHNRQRLQKIAHAIDNYVAWWRELETEAAMTLGGEPQYDEWRAFVNPQYERFFQTVIPVAIDATYSSLQNHARAMQLANQSFESTVEWANAMKEHFESVAADLRAKETDVGIITWLISGLGSLLFGDTGKKIVGVGLLIAAVVGAIYLGPPLFRGLSRRLESGKKVDNEA